MATSAAGKSGQSAIGRVVRSRGFTLLELMIVVVIIAILSAIAYPSYINYVTKTKRNAASACLSEYANYMERYYTTNLRYDQDTSATANALPQLDCATMQRTGDTYSYTLPTASLKQAKYKILATPTNAQLTRDTKCGVLAIDQSGQRYYQSTKTDSTGLSDCWK